MKYFSTLGPNDEDLAQRIYQKFVAEFPHLSPLLDCPDINDANPTLTDPERVTAESHHILIALQQDDFIHITCHGDADSISLIDPDILKLKELVLATDAMRKIKARAIILLNCGSGGSTIGARSIARALNQGGVPVVIGMTRITDPEVARRFVGGFYYALAAWPSEGLEKAIVHGRLGILRLVDDTHEVTEDIFSVAGNWHAGFGIPRLFLSRPNSVLIPQDLLFGSDAMRKDFDRHISGLLPEIKIKLNKDLDNIIDWVEQGQKPWYFVTGREGIGTSTLMAQLIDKVKRDKKHKIIYHFCRPNGSSLLGDPADPLAFIRYSLAPQLKANFANYHDFIPPGRFPLLVGNTRQAVKDFALDPLEKIVNSGTEPPLIVIDDVHFFRPGHGFENSILKLLFDDWGDLVNVARFVIAADVTNPIAQQKLEALLGEPDLCLLPE
jgi:hypothetical protein